MGYFVHPLADLICLQRLTVPFQHCELREDENPRTWNRTVKEICLHDHDRHNKTRTRTNGIRSFLQRFPVANSLVLHTPYYIIPLEHPGIPEAITHIQTLSFEGYLGQDSIEMILPMFPCLTCLRFEYDLLTYIPLDGLSSDESCADYSIVASHRSVKIFESLLRKDNDSQEFVLCPLLEKLEIFGLNFSSKRVLALQEMMRARADRTSKSPDASSSGFRLTLRTCTFGAEPSKPPTPNVRNLAFPVVERIFRGFLLA